jgi:pyruvate/2-oxoglutarate dehydrogenase complex dihydrolipoamide acyltransferase (E2) component
VSRIDLTVPDLGNFDEVAIVDVLIKVGDKIDVDTPLVTLETDKATMDFVQPPAPCRSAGAKGGKTGEVA